MTKKELGIAEMVRDTVTKLKGSTTADIVSISRMQYAALKAARGSDKDIEEFLGVRFKVVEL